MRREKTASDVQYSTVRPAEASNTKRRFGVGCHSGRYKLENTLDLELVFTTSQTEGLKDAMLSDLDEQMGPWDMVGRNILATQAACT